jgi:hypothetical protein
MIVAKLIGGLGNQLFQYAAGRALAVHHGTDLLLDTSFLEQDPKGGYTKRNFELDAFNINARIASSNNLQQFPLNGGRMQTKLKSLFPGLFNTLVFNESQQAFDPRFLKLPENTYLNGYWQDQRYFLPIREQLLKELALKDAPSEQYNLLLKKINDSNSVSIHVRRGDYVSLPAAGNFHGLADLDYYRHAVEQLEKEHKDLHYFIFSDDLAWCEQHLNFLKDVTFVYGEKLGLSAQQELILMSHCRHQVIANSSFSWWAAWLNTNPGKTVIAPEFWFAKKRSRELSILPREWQTVA